MIEREEENDFYSTLREELRAGKEGGSDIHFSQFDIDKLSKGALDLYEKYKKKNPKFGSDLEEFRRTTITNSDDFYFAAMLLNWNIGCAYKKRCREREAKKKLAV